MDKKRLLQTQLHKLTEQHRALDDSIKKKSRSADVDMLEMQRLKKQKLVLKDKISDLQKRVTADTST